MDLPARFGDHETRYLCLEHTIFCTCMMGGVRNYKCKSNISHNGCREWPVPAFYEGFDCLSLDALVFARMGASYNFLRTSEW